MCVCVCVCVINASCAELSTCLLTTVSRARLKAFIQFKNYIMSGTGSNQHREDNWVAN